MQIFYMLYMFYTASKIHTHRNLISGWALRGRGRVDPRRGRFAPPGVARAAGFTLHLTFGANTGKIYGLALQSAKRS